MFPLRFSGHGALLLDLEHFNLTDLQVSGGSYQLHSESCSLPGIDTSYRAIDQVGCLAAIDPGAQ